MPDSRQIPWWQRTLSSFPFESIAPQVGMLGQVGRGILGNVFDPNVNPLGFPQEAGARRTPAQLSATSADILARNNIPLPEKATVAPATPGELVRMNQRAAQDALNALTGGAGGGLPEPYKGKSLEEAQALLAQLGGQGAGYYLTQDPNDPSSWTVGFSSSLIQNQQSRQPTRYQPWGQNPYDDPNTPQVEGQFNPYTGQWEPPANYIPAYQSRQLEQQQSQFEAEQKFREDQLAFQREQAQIQAEFQKAQQLAELRANPYKWLQAASFAGETPGVQPWMVPLGMNLGLQVGQELPGFNPGAETMNLPQLTTPSAQYLSRLAPSARAQYAGYEQARTGANPEDTLWMSQQSAPPSGRRPVTRARY